MEGFDDLDKATGAGITMARKSKSTRRSPTQKSTFLSASFPTGNTTDVQIDVSRCLSIMNNRMYRQGHVYKCSLEMTPQVAVQNSGVKLEVFALNDNWLNQEAWRLGKETWDAKYEDEMEKFPDKQRARWRDFRVASGSTAIEMSPNTIDLPSDTGQRTSSGPGVSTPIAAVVDKVGTIMDFSWGAPSGTTYSIISEMQEGGYNKETTSPTTSTGGEPYAGLTADSSDAEGNLYQTLGKEPPYGLGANTFNPFVQVATLGFSQDVAAGAWKLSTGNFMAPCGILLVRYVNQAQDLALDLKLTVADGNYQGVHALPMA